MTIAQTQIDATKRPTITIFTIGCADQNRPQIERSDEVSGAVPAGGASSVDCAHALATGRAISSTNEAKPSRCRNTDCAASAFFMKLFLPSSIVQPSGAPLGSCAQHGTP